MLRRKVPVKKEDRFFYPYKMYKSFKILFLFFLFVGNFFAQEPVILKLDLKEKALPFGLIKKVPKNFPKVSLVLSGGGSRAISQLGVMRALEEAEIPVTSIYGTSMGSILGGLYSAGYSLEELDSIVINASWEDYFSAERTNRNDLFIDQKITEDKAILTIRFDGFTPIIPTSINTGQSVANFLTLLAINAPIRADSSFKNLLYDFGAVSADLITGNSILLSGGSLAQAMRASSSVSLLLPPVRQDSLLLVDGGIIANVPVKIAKDLNSDMIIASNATSPLRKEGELKYPWEIADQLVSIPSKIINDQYLEYADFLIEPDINSKKNNDFTGLRNLIEEGYRAVLPQIDSIKKSVERKIKNSLADDLIFYKNLELKENPSSKEKKFFEKFSGRKSVSNKELLFELYEIYENGGIKNISIKIDTLGGRNVLSLEEEKNRIINDVIIFGSSPLNKSQLNYILSNLKEKPYCEKSLFNGLLEVSRFYRTKGYSLAQIESVDFNERNGILDVKISEGIVSEVLVLGTKRTNHQVITREFPISSGDIFKFEKAAEGLRNLQSTGLFEAVEISVQQKGNRNVIRLNIIEEYSKILRFGLRIDNEYLTQASIDFRNENFYGTGTEIGANITLGVRNRSYILEHKANRIFDTYFTYKLRGFYSMRDINVYSDDSSRANIDRNKSAEYKETHTGVSLGIGTQVERLGNFIVEGKYQQDEINNQINFSGEGVINLATLKFIMSIDSRNKYPYPMNGFLAETYYETAQKVLGGDVSYTKFALDYSGFISFSDVHTIIPHFLIGFADKTLPLSQQFSLGGQFSFFGFRDYEYRGRQVFLSSLKYRAMLPVKIYFDTYLSIRYDLGSTWEKEEQIRFRDLKHGIGATFSLDTPIGPADFSVGKSFTFENKPEEKYVNWGDTYFYFTIGYYY